MSTLLRFEGDNSGRGVSGALWKPVADWPSGATPGLYVGSLVVEDFVPHNTGNYTTAGSGTESVALRQERHGVVRVSQSAAANGTAGFELHTVADLSEDRPYVLEARVEQNADANSPQVFVGLSDQDADSVWSSSAINSSAGVDTLGLRWNADETVDLVSVVDGGDLNTLESDIATVERTDGYVKLGIRVVKETSSSYSVYSSVNGAVTKTHGLTTSQIPQNAMNPVVSTTVNDTTAISMDVDWVACHDKV